MTLPDPSRVAARHQIRLAARRAVSSFGGVRFASSDPFLDQVLVAAAEGALIPPHGVPVRVAGVADIARKMVEFARAVKRAPKLLERLVELLGVGSLAELPARFREMAREGYAFLRRALGKAFSSFPLKLFTLPESKLFSVNQILDSWVSRSPRFKAFLDQSVKPRVDQFDRWLRENLPAVSKALMVGVYLWVWFNVVEFEWDLKSLLDAATGHLTLTDLLGSLPGSALGALLNFLHLGTFTLLPAAIAARLLFLLANRYVSWNGSGFSFDSEKLRADFGIEGAEA